MTLQAAIAATQVIVAAVTGIKQAPAYAPEQISEFPISIAYAGQGRVEFGPGGGMKALRSIVIEIHVSRLDLPRDLQEVMGYADSVPSALLADPTLGGTCSTFESIDYDFGPLGYGSMETIGFRFIIQNVKILS